MTTLHALHPLSGMFHFHPRTVFSPRQGGILFVRLSDKPLTASQKTELARVLLGQPLKVKKLGDNFTDVEDQSLRQTLWMFSPLRNPGIEKLENIHLHFAVNEGDEHAILVQHVFEEIDSTVSMENVRRFLQLAAHSTAHIEFGAPPVCVDEKFLLSQSAFSICQTIQQKTSADHVCVVSSNLSPSFTAHGRHRRCCDCHITRRGGYFEGIWCKCVGLSVI